MQLKRNAIAEQRFRTTLKRNLTSAIEISQHNLLKKADIYHYCDRNETKLSSMYRIALLTEKKLKAQRN